jgi:hypothetical protein
VPSQLTNWRWGTSKVAGNGALLLASKVPVGVKVQIQPFPISAQDRGDNRCLRDPGGGGDPGPEGGLGPGPNMPHAFLLFSTGSRVIR